MTITEVTASNGEKLKLKKYVKHIKVTGRDPYMKYCKSERPSIIYNPDGPSIICFNGTEYYTNDDGDTHREDGPAVIHKRKYTIKKQVYYETTGFSFALNGKRFRSVEELPQNLFMVYCSLKNAYDSGELQKMYNIRTDEFKLFCY